MSRRRRRSSEPSTSSDGLYIDHGDCDCVCTFCGAFFWFGERLVGQSTNHTLVYNQCCRGGRVVLPSPTLPHSVFIDLFDDLDFLANIRAYNSMFSMTSFGGKVDESINSGSAPYVFKVSGQVCHWLGSMCPPENQSPRFLQMYIYDTDNEASNRLRFFGGTSSDRISESVVSLLINTLNETNQLVKLFRCARELCIGSNVPNFSVRLFNSYNCQSYDMPSAGTIGAIVSDPDPHSIGYDIVIRHRTDGPRRISYLHPLYMSLQYPLLFTYGEGGWSPSLRLTPAPNKVKDELTLNMFYSYKLHDRVGTYSLLLRGGRLFQQYLVDAYMCIEQNRLDFVRYHQSQLRSEVLKGIEDAIQRGDTVGRDIGRRTILPSSFTGGPCYMYKHYQDALAICRVHGNPQYFITFTCNVRWPEIDRYMSQFPALRAQDRPDVIARVFQLKVVSLVNFLLTRKPFGKVVAYLYTIEFQKRGLPHCHLLLWVDDYYKITSAEQLDNYISAEIPDFVTDPDLHSIVTDRMIHGPCGLLSPSCSCMRSGTCSKKFPKPYQPSTTFDSNGYARYK